MHAHDTPAGSLRISEMFYSLQGEGILTGTPSFFIRLTGCNLRCTWCDTPYTSWKPEGDDRTLAWVIEETRKTRPNRHVVVTGGEPMIAPKIIALTRALEEEAFHITIETAGTVFEPVACDLMSISPKLSNSTPHEREEGRWAPQHERLRRQPDILKQLIAAYDYQLKFVIADPNDIAEATELVTEIKADPTKVVLMPEGTTAQAIASKAQWIAEACKTHCYRYSPRLHIDLWGDKRGV